MPFRMMPVSRRVVLALSVTVAGAAAMPFPSFADAPSEAPAATRPLAPDYAGLTRSVRVPFASTRPINFDKLNGMWVRASINGGPTTSFMVDTGSVGIIVGADEVPNIDPNAPSGSITYSSSGIELDGVWTDATVTFVDARDADGNPATANVPVSAARERKIHPGAVNGGRAQPTTNPKVHMFGVGFGRGREAHPERNPFVNLAEMQAGTMRRGYTITRDGYTLGLTKAVVGDGYRFERLTERAVSAETAARRAGPKDWESSRGRAIVNGVAQPDAAMLYDTGLTNMMIGVPGVTENKEIEPGAVIAIELLGGQLRYEFKAGDTTDPVSPRKVTWVPPRPDGGSTVNTGLRALSIYDYLYDADGGYLGLRPTAVHR